MKLVRRLALVAVAALVLLLLAGWLLVTPASRAAVEKGGRYALGVETSLEDVSLSPGFGRSAVGFSGLSIANPEGFAGAPFLDIDGFSVGVRTMSLMSKTVRVPEISLDGLHLRLIQDGQRSNFAEIVGHIRSLGSAGEGGGGGGGGAAPPGETAAAGSPGPSLALGRVHVAGVKTTLELRGLPGLEPLTKTFSLPAFDLDMAEYLGMTEGASGGGSGGETRASVGDLTAALIDRLVELGIEEAANHVDPELAALLQGGLDDARAVLEAKLESEAEELLDEAKGDLEDKLEEELGGKIDGGLKDLLGGDG